MSPSTPADLLPLIAAGAQMVVRDEEWIAGAVQQTPADGLLVRCIGTSLLVRDTEATFLTSLDNIQPLHCFLRLPGDKEQWTVLAATDDSNEAVVSPDHRARWQEYLQWTNVLQFLRDVGREPLIVATSMGDDAVDGAWLLDMVGVGTSDEVAAPDVAAVVSADMAEELDLVEDDQVRALVRAVLEVGALDFVAGFELPDGIPMEAAWPDQQVGVVMIDSEGHAGWQLRTADDWPIADLAKALER